MTHMSKFIVLIFLPFSLFSRENFEYKFFDKHHMALCIIESDLKHKTKGKILISEHGAIGICQIKLDVKKDIQCGNIYDENQNIDCSERYLYFISSYSCKNFIEYKKFWSCVIAAYHDGPNAVRNNNGNAVSIEGKQHVKKFWEVINGTSKIHKSISSYL